MLQAAGQEAGALKRSTALTLAAAVAQGLAFACFYPFFSALLDTPARPGSAVFWLTAMTLCTLADALARWVARRFDYSESFATITHDLRMSLGRQLRNMPLETLYRKTQRRAGFRSGRQRGRGDHAHGHVFGRVHQHHGHAHGGGRC